MASLAVLAVLAARLNREAGRPPIPALYFFTDPVRTPDPAKVATRLPRGTAIVFRHFGAPDRLAQAKALKRICRRRGLKLFIAADPALARQVNADGVHWPESRAPARRLPRGRGTYLQIVAAHSRRALARAAAAGFDACVLAPVFVSRSRSAARALGAIKAGGLARGGRLPVIALGGVTANTARRLIGRGFAGLAAVDAFLGA